MTTSKPKDGSRLRHWQRFDTLQADVGCALLLGIDPTPHSLEMLRKHRQNLYAPDGPEAIEADLFIGLRMLLGSEVIDLDRFVQISASHQLYLDYWQSGVHPDQTPQSYFIKWAREKDLAYAEVLESADQSKCNQPSGTDAVIGRGHVSNKLAVLNQAAQHFWANADRDYRGSHPQNRDVVLWLRNHGFSAATAEKAASIIRPEWAPLGRKPDE